MEGPRERMKIVRSVRLRPDQYKRHWEDYGISLRSGHIRNMLDFADESERFLRGIVDKSIPCSGELYYTAKRILAEAEHGRD